MALSRISQRAMLKIAATLDQITKTTKNICNRIFTPFKSTYDKHGASVGQAILVMIVMGWTPVERMFLGVFLSAYTILKAIKKKDSKWLFLEFIFAYFNKIKNFIFGSKEERKNDRRLKKNTFFLWHHTLQWIGDKVNNSPLAVFKFILSTYFFIVYGILWGSFMIYALYHPRAAALEAIYNFIQSLQAQFLSFFNQLSNVKKLLVTLVGVALTVNMLNIIKSNMFNSLLLGFLGVGTFVFMTGLTLAGIVLFCKDFKKELSNPIKLVASKMGIILGAIQGNYLAHVIFSGKVTGTLGYAYGTVKSSSVFSSLYGLIFTNNPFTHSAIGFFNNLFFSYNLSTYGYFHGVLGPTTFQLCFFMILGGVVGHYIDRYVAIISKSIYSDLKKIWKKDPGTLTSEPENAEQPEPVIPSPPVVVDNNIEDRLATLLQQSAEPRLQADNNAVLPEQPTVPALIISTSVIREEDIIPAATPSSEVRPEINTPPLSL